MSELSIMRKEAARLERELAAMQDELQVTQVLSNAPGTKIAQVHIEVFSATAQVLFEAEEYTVRYTYKTVSDATGMLEGMKGDRTELQHIVDARNSEGVLVEDIDDHMHAQFRLALKDEIEKRPVMAMSMPVDTRKPRPSCWG